LILLKQQIIEYDSINIITTHPNWDSATTYSAGEIMFYEHYYYKSVIDDNLNNPPLDNQELWLRWAVSNRYAQVDLRATTYTTWNASTATVPADNALISTFTNSNYDAIAFGGVSGGDVLIEMLNDTQQVVWSQSEAIYNRPTSNNWYGYYFDAFRVGSESSFLFRPPIHAGTTTFRVTITANEDGQASVGYMMAGNSEWVGCSEFGATLGLDDNSIVEIDDWGIKTVTKRIASSYMSIDVVFSANKIKQMERTVTKFFGDIVLFVGDDQDNSDYEHLSTLGYVESYNVILANTEQIRASYSIKEVI